jgi:hypothetical protein
MTTPALITMLVTMAIVSLFAGYFFIKVLRLPVKKKEVEE